MKTRAALSSVTDSIPTRRDWVIAAVLRSRFCIAKQEGLLVCPECLHWSMTLPCPGREYFYCSYCYCSYQEPFLQSKYLSLIHHLPEEER